MLLSGTKYHSEFSSFDSYGASARIIDLINVVQNYNG
jgi:hypothetical protein